MNIIKKSVYTKQKWYEIIVKNVNEYYGRMLVDALNEKLGDGCEWKVVLVSDGYIEWMDKNGRIRE